MILKNTGIRSAEDFKEFEPLLYEEAMAYEGGESNRNELGSGVLSVSTFEPPQMDIVLHNELVYQDEFPARIAFCGFERSPVGGVTALADNRRISKYMPPRLAEKLERLGFLAVHNYQNLEAQKAGEPWWYNTWQEAYLVETKAEI